MFDTTNTGHEKKGFATRLVATAQANVQKKRFKAAQYGGRKEKRTPERGRCVRLLRAGPQAAA